MWSEVGTPGTRTAACRLRLLWTVARDRNGGRRLVARWRPRPGREPGSAGVELTVPGGATAAFAPAVRRP